MSTNDLAQRRKYNVRLYAAGGGGTNIASTVEQYRAANEIGFGNLDITYIDTSRSNLSKHIPNDACYLIDGLDGSGKIRSENYQAITKVARDILQQHKPGDLNIILSTGAGGSGSVIGPVLTGELLSRECPTVVLCVGSSQTRLDTENSLKTLKSYEALAKKYEVPVVLHYQQNGASKPRSKVDQEVRDVIVSLCALFSGENHELDSRDLFNFLRFDRTTSFGAQVALLQLRDVSDESIDIPGNIISVATLASGPDDQVELSQRPEYQCVGFMPEGIDSELLALSPVHFITCDGMLGTIAQDLSKILSEMDTQQRARIDNGGILGERDKATDHGVVL